MKVVESDISQVAALGQGLDKRRGRGGGAVDKDVSPAAYGGDRF
jgi:hypothetical protein